MKTGPMKIGFVGLGQMGLVMAPHLLRDGWRVTGHDLVEPSDLPGDIIFTASLKDLADSDVIITMLPDGAAVTSVVDQLITASCTAMFIDMSSSHPDDSRALAQRLADLGLAFVDAPVSGGVARARAAELTIMAGGNEAAGEMASTLAALTAQMAEIADALKDTQKNQRDQNSRLGEVAAQLRNGVGNGGNGGNGGAGPGGPKNAAASRTRCT